MTQDQAKGANTMKTVSVNSSFIDDITFRPERMNDNQTEDLGTLVVTIGDKQYEALDVPESVFDEMCLFDSKGSFFNCRIKGVYKVRRMK